MSTLRVFFCFVFATAIGLCVFWLVSQSQDLNQKASFIAIGLILLMICISGGKIPPGPNNPGAHINPLIPTSTKDTLTDLESRNPSNKLTDEKRSKINGILRDSIKRGKLNEFLIANGLCPSLTKLNAERYAEIGRVDPIIALRALALGLEIILKNYCSKHNIAWMMRAPSPTERVNKLVEEKILDDDEGAAFRDIFSVVELAVQGSAIDTEKTLSTCIDKSEQLMHNYIDWLLEKFEVTATQREIAEMKDLLR